MADREPEAHEFAFNQVASGLAAGAISRATAVKALFGGVVAGLASRVAVSPHPAKARKRKQLKTLFAVVAADATLIRGKGVTSVFRGVGGQPGDYDVRFNRDVNTCAYVATTINGLAGQTSVTGVDLLPESVLVNTTNSSGTGEDLGFCLIVIC
jgi:hypothetical protein